MRRPLGAVLLAVAAGLAAPTTVRAEETRWVILVGKEASVATQTQCSRTGSPVFQDIWEPKEADLRALEGHLAELESLKPKCCCQRCGRLQHVNDYFKQYVGIVVDGRTLIYVNAFSERVKPSNWRTVAVILCDAAEDAFGVVFDPATGTLEDFEINAGG